MKHRKCRTWRCGFKISDEKDHCPNCGMPKGLSRRMLTLLRLAPKYPNLRQAEREAWSTIDSARDELDKLTTLEGDLTGFHKPKLTPAQKEALQKGRAHIIRKAKPGLTRLKAIEAARWQNGWVPVVMRLADEGLNDPQLADIDQQLYRHTRLGSALNKRWKHGIPGYEGLFDRSVRSLEPSIFRLAVTIIRIREWVSVRRTLGGLAGISAFTDGPPDMHDMPTNDISEWLETIYDRDDELERLTHETLRLEAEEDVDRLLG
ncbi:MAG: hypothetical protein IH968_16290 [Gemmatimonadetes bacterium]|nr:hypothetical protein [Gemmatimonadota bacterium]